MSYDVVKNISKRKDGRIFITSASNNVWPRTYETWEYMKNENCSEDKIENKELYLFYNILGGDFELSSCINQKYKYASNKFFEYCRENAIDTYELWKLPRGENDSDITKLKPYYEIFSNYLNEKKEGKFYLDSNVGVITKINKKTFKSTFYPDLSKKSTDYKKTFNEYSKLSQSAKEQYDVKIKEYVLNNENINEEKQDLGMEL